MIGSKGEHKKIVGTPDYMAPETIDETSMTKGTAMDWWAIGCIIYEFITGVNPFNATSVEEVWSNIRNKKIEWPQIGYQDDCMSPEAKDLIERLLEVDPSKRLSNLKDAKMHPFFKGTCCSLQASIGKT